MGNPRHGGPEKKGGTTPHSPYQYHYHRLFLIVIQIGPLNAYKEQTCISGCRDGEIDFELPLFNCMRTCENGENKYFVIENFRLHKWLWSGALL